MNVVIINDCRDENAKGRQLIRATHLFGSVPQYIGVTNELEAAGNIIDVLDSLDGNEGVVLVNVAPRHGAAKKWENGTPFGYFMYGKTLIVSTVDGLVLSLAKKFGLIADLRVLDTTQSVDQLIGAGRVDSSLRSHIIKSQFRSFDFLPRIAAYIYEIKQQLGETLSLETIPDVPQAVWFIDNFGNCKTTLLSDQRSEPLPFGASFYDRLKDVPHGQPAFIVGSSGFKERRFLEIVVQGESAANHFGLKIGSQF